MRHRHRERDGASANAEMHRLPTSKRATTNKVKCWSLTSFQRHTYILWVTFVFCPGDKTIKVSCFAWVIYIEWYFLRSVVVPEHLKGYIYVEAFKQAHVKQAIEGEFFVLLVSLSRWGGKNYLRNFMPWPFSLYITHGVHIAHIFDKLNQIAIEKISFVSPNGIYVPDALLL